MDTVEATALEFEAALVATRPLRYGIGILGGAFGAMSGFSFVSAVPHVTIPTIVVFSALTAGIYGFATYGAMTLAMEMQYAAERKTAEAI